MLEGLWQLESQGRVPTVVALTVVAGCGGTPAGTL